MALSYKWQKSTDGSSWDDIAGATSASYQVTTSQSTAIQYRCIVTSSVSGLSTTSNEATLTMKANPVTITTQPVSVVSHIGSDVEFIVQSSVAYGSVTYQWQYKESGGQWQDSTLDTAKNSVLRVSVSSASDGRSYRCVVTATAGGSSTTSNAATLTTYKAPSITKQPTNKEGFPTETVMFTITAQEQ